MTAIVGILNKRAAVMAADSAVTVEKGGRSKIYNTATKIFRLSSEHPVGAMIFSSSEFMFTPWDVIFKLYRDRRGGQGFNTLKEYAQNFVDFLKSENYFSSVDSQKEYFLDELSKFYCIIRDSVIEEYESRTSELSDGEKEELDVDALMHEIVESELNRVEEIYKDAGVNSEFEGYTIDNLRSFGKDTLDKLKKAFDDDGLPADMQELWEEKFFSYIRSKHYYSESGVVFVGYGEKDIYPSILPVYISGAFDHRLRFYFDEDRTESVSNDDKAFICPFAQTDVMMTLMKGIAPDMFKMAQYQNHKSIQAVKDGIVEKLKEANVEQKVIDSVINSEQDKIQEEFIDNILEYVQNEYVEGIIDAVDAFNIEDMVNMAESLIAVTNLHRHISSSDESVGGPIDVAVITRSEGFIWVKHKDWFQKDLNPQIKMFD